MLKRIGEEFDIKVSVENATQVIGLNTWITYDPDIVEVVDSDPTGSSGTQVIATDLGFFGASASLLANIKTNGNEIPGTVIVGHATVPPSPVDGSGDAFSIRFKAIGAGNTNIDFEVGHVNLQDMDGDIPTDAVGDTVEVPATATVRLTVI